jgi:NADPH:quinone reductase
MRVITVPAPGGAQVLKIAEIERPRTGPGEVLIRVVAAGINRADILQREGHYPPPPGASPILGLEVSGQIVELGPDTDSQWSIGDPVCALLAGGGYAEFCVAPAGQCLLVPAAISLTDAAALPEAVFTVWCNLFQPQRLAAGESLLVQGGSSGIGTMAIQVATAFGARVIATAGSAEKCRACETLGCERAFNYREEDWAAGALAWSGSQGIDVILDMVGGEYFCKHIDLLARRGRLIHIAHAKGYEVTLDLRSLMSKQLIVTGSTLRSRPVAEKQSLRDSIRERVWPMVATGRIRPVVDRVYPLDQVAEAHERMQSGQHVGKILLQLQ